MPLIKAEPPPRKSAPKSSASSVPARKTQVQRRYEGLQSLSQFGGAFCLSRGWYADAGAIGLHGPVICRETALIAEKHEPIGKVLDYLAEAGPYTALVMAVVKLTAQIAANHGKVKPEQLAGLDVVPPELLEARAQAEFMELRKMAAEEQEKVNRQMAEAGMFDGAPGH